VHIIMVVQNNKTKVIHGIIKYNKKTDIYTMCCGHTIAGRLVSYSNHYTVLNNDISDMMPEMYTSMVTCSKCIVKIKKAKIKKSRSKACLILIDKEIDSATIIEDSDTQLLQILSYLQQNMQDDEIISELNKPLIDRRYVVFFATPVFLTPKLKVTTEVIGLTIPSDKHNT